MPPFDFITNKRNQEYENIIADDHFSFIVYISSNSSEN